MKSINHYFFVGSTVQNTWVVAKRSRLLFIFPRRRRRFRCMLSFVFLAMMRVEKRGVISKSGTVDIEQWLHCSFEKKKEFLKYDTTAALVVNCGTMGGSILRYFFLYEETRASVPLFLDDFTCWPQESWYSLFQSNCTVDKNLIFNDISNFGSTRTSEGLTLDTLDLYFLKKNWCPKLDKNCWIETIFLQNETFLTIFKHSLYRGICMLQSWYS